MVWHIPVFTLSSIQIHIGLTEMARVMTIFNDAVEGCAHGGVEYIASKAAAILDGITYKDWVSHSSEGGR